MRRVRSRMRSASSRPCASGVRPAGRQRRQPLLRHGGGRGRRQELLGGDPAKGDDGDLVALGVGVVEQGEHGPLDELHPLAGGHRSGSVDDEDDQRAARPDAFLAMQIARGDARPAVGVEPGEGRGAKRGVDRDGGGLLVADGADVSAPIRLGEIASADGGARPGPFRRDVDARSRQTGDGQRDRLGAGRRVLRPRRRSLSATTWGRHSVCETAVRTAGAAGGAAAPARRRSGRPRPSRGRDPAMRRGPGPPCGRRDPRAGSRCRVRSRASRCSSGSSRRSSRPAAGPGRRRSARAASTARRSSARRIRPDRARSRGGGGRPRCARPGRAGSSTVTIRPKRSSNCGRRSPSSGFIVPISRKRAGWTTLTCPRAAPC